MVRAVTSSSLEPNWIDNVAASLGYDSQTNTAVFTFAGVLPEANYRAVLSSEDVANGAGEPLASDHVDDFFFLVADASGPDGVPDRLVGVAAAIPAVWGEFADRSVTRVDGVTMVYDPAQLGHTALTPLSRGDGHGQCSSWADLLAQMFGTQGINAQQRLIAPGAGYDEFQVADGPVQGGVVLTAPNTQFTFHVVVELSAVPDRIYDASFGVITNKTTAGSVELQWEADHVVDFRDVGSPPFIPPFWIHANPVGQQLDWSNWP